MTENSNAGNAEAPVGEQATNTQDKINPGAIRKSTTQNILNALSSVSGVDFNSVEDAVEFIAQQNKPAPKVEQNDGNEQPTATPDNDLQEQFQKLKRDLDIKEKALRQKELDSEIIKSMGDRFDPDLLDYALQKAKSSVKLNRDGSYSIVNSRGQERYDQDGQLLTLSGLVDELAQSNPKLLKQAQVSGGSGLRPGQDRFAGAPLDQVPDYSRDPAAFDAWAKNMGLGKGTGLKGTTVSASISSQARKVL